MRIYKFSRVVAVPFGIWGIYLLVKSLNDPYSNSLAWIVIPLAALILTYLFSPQIDYWWLGKQPLPLDEKIRDMLTRVNPFYRNYDEETRARFDKRLLLFTEAKAFIAKGGEDVDVPYDIKHLIAQAAVTLTMNREDFLMEKFERVVLYKHPFPSPRFKFLHAFETEVEDGVVILSLEHVEKGVFFPQQYYNVLFHAYAEVFMKSFPGEEYPEAGPGFWDKFEELTGFPQHRLMQNLGFESLDRTGFLITCYFTHREDFPRYFPEAHERLVQIFGQ